MTNKLVIYAEQLPYWQTSQSSADHWLERCQKEITSIAGTIKMQLFGADDSGRAAFRLDFEIAQQRYRLSWPMLPSKTGNVRAAKIQAATALYHDVKARVVAAKFLGVRNAFLPYLLLENGQTAGEASNSELSDRLPRLLLGSGK